jgi:tetratricopeptide (TPR) repeat protein
MKSNKKIYQNINRDDLKQYQSETNSFAKNQTEKKALQSNFDADTLDGFENHPDAFQALNRMDRKFFKQKFTLYKIVGSITIILLVLVGAYQLNKSAASHVQIKQAEIIEKTDYKTAEHIELMKPLNENKQIKVSEIKAELKKHKENNVTVILHEHNSPIAEPVSIEKLPTKKIETPETQLAPVSNAKKGKEIVLSDLLLIDYRAYRSKPSITIETMLLTGLPANEEKATSEEPTSTWTKQDIPYIDYLSKSIQFFSKGKTKKALERFEVILKTYPDDLNALFYGGLCYYNLGQFNQAKQNFETCLNNEFLNFNEEANWYLMKSLKELGEETKAKALYNKIKKEGGFYANYSY